MPIKKLTNIEDLITDLNERPDNYTIKLTDSDDFARAFTLFDDSDEFTLEDDKVLVSEQANVVIYKYKNYEISLIANFTDDIYKILVEEVA